MVVGPPRDLSGVTLVTAARRLPTLSYAGRLALLAVLSAGSGCAALIYEVVWLQILQFRFGSTTLAVGLLLATFMGGLCLGSILLPRLVSAVHHPFRVYALLEIGIAACGLLVMTAPLAGVVATLLMGATLPALARWFRQTPEGFSWLGFIYAANIAGAVFGCLLAGFYLLRIYDMPTATFVAAGINAAVGLGALALALVSPNNGSEVADADGGTAEGSRVVYAAIALSGFGALGAEVVWTRQLALLFGATVYSFSIILATFLGGLGLGSAVAGNWLRTIKDARRGLAWCQALLVLAVGWSALSLATTLPRWPAQQSDIFNPWQTFQMDLLRAAWAIIPAAVLWGASFPLALASIRREGDNATPVGRLYAANTAGAIAGALWFSAYLVPVFGSHNAERWLVGIAAAAAALLLVPRRLVVAMILLASLVAWKIPAVPDLVIAYGRDFATRKDAPPNILYAGEGRNSSIAVSEWPNGVRNFHVAGKVEASTEAKDMRLERMLGHLSALAHPAPKSVLVVGFGSGITAGTFTRYPGIDRIVICEIEPLIPRRVAPFFSKANHDVYNDPRVEIVYDDARHYIRTTNETFDVITSDPIHPWVKGAAILYTTEYFEMVRGRLNPGGVVTQWVPLYDSTADVVKSEFATFFRTFPDGAVWSNDIAGKGYDVVLLAGANLENIEPRLLRAPGAKQSLAEVGFPSAQSLFATYAGAGRDMAPWLTGSAINTDRNLRLQYIAGMGAINDDPDGIYHAFLKYRKAP